MTMVISLLGVGSDSLLTELDAAGIQYIRLRPESGQVMNAGEWIEIAKATAPYAAVAAVLVAWIRARASRKVIVTLEDNKVLQTEGMSASEIERLLPLAKTIAAAETKKPSRRKKKA
jgi:hypothetical protein